MHIIYFIYIKNNDVLYMKYMVRIDSIIGLNIEYITNINMSRECNINLLNNEDFIHILEGVNVLGFNKQSHLCNCNIVIIGEDLGIYISKYGFIPRLFNISIHSIRKIISSNITDIKNYMGSTLLVLDPTKLDILLDGYEDKILDILSIINMSAKLLDHICSEPRYNKHITLLDPYVEYYIAHEVSYHTLQYFSYKYLIRMYHETKDDKLLEYISKRDDIPVDMEFLLSKTNFNTTIKLLSIMHNVSIILYDEYDEYQYLELSKLVRTGRYYINVAYNNSSIPNILLKLEIWNKKEHIYSLSHSTPIKLMKYCSRLFPLGLDRFYEFYVKNGSKRLKYYYRIYMLNINKDSYQQYPSDINIITYR